MDTKKPIGVTLVNWFLWIKVGLIILLLGLFASFYINAGTDFEYAMTKRTIGPIFTDFPLSDKIAVLFGKLILPFILALGSLVCISKRWYTALIVLLVLQLILSTAASIIIHDGLFIVISLIMLALRDSRGYFLPKYRALSPKKIDRRITKH